MCSATLKAVLAPSPAAITICSPQILLTSPQAYIPGTEVAPYTSTSISPLSFLSVNLSKLVDGVQPTSIKTPETVNTSSPPVCLYIREHRTLHKLLPLFQKVHSHQEY